MPKPSLLIFAVLVAACGKNATTGPKDLGSEPDASQIKARPYEVDVPEHYDASKPTPLILLLHGYGASGEEQDAYFAFSQLADDKTVLVAHPDGTVDSTGNRFWNADDACCNLDNLPVDDVKYLNAVVDDVEAHYNVDEKQVFVVGHSNGAFMAHRLACDSTPRFAAIAAFAGDVWKDPSKCNPTGPIAVAQIHGDADTMVPYAGTATMPSAMESVATWAAKNGCTGALTPTGTTYDFVGNLPGAETEVDAYACAQGAAELWTIHGGGHIPNLTSPTWGDTIFAWLTAHKRK
jgi:polyhydroxybutyrate depolymerase